MVLDKTKEGIRPRYLIYDIVQFEVCYLQEPAEEGRYLLSLYTFPPPQGSSEVAQCDHKRRLLCVQKELIEPRDAAVSNESTLNAYPYLKTYPACSYSERVSLYGTVTRILHSWYYTLWQEMDKRFNMNMYDTNFVLTPLVHKSLGMGWRMPPWKARRDAPPGKKFCRWQADTLILWSREKLHLPFFPSLNTPRPLFYEERVWEWA